MDPKSVSTALSEGPSTLTPTPDWPFSQSELAAGLRRYTGDPTLTISSLQAGEIFRRRPCTNDRHHR